MRNILNEAQAKYDALQHELDQALRKVRQLKGGTVAPPDNTADLQYRLDMALTELKEVKARRTPQPDIVNAAPGIDWRATLKLATDRHEATTAILQREINAFREKVTRLESDNGKLNIDLAASVRATDELQSEIEVIQENNYPGRIQEAEEQMRGFRDRIAPMEATIGQQRLIIAKLELKIKKGGSS